ncbi:hypothetical protein Ahy_B03g068314 isoform B [Arachis hypogaea]|uniref:Pentatricopeptide repeat-containing protein n=1 Tax=Arachis hypogaea TaxID=3818 RepID=A0A445A9C0_ARAHY|nr:hypothetical protein Ahy_B03g068314 isoform B [Arachis hypogaea]
MASRRCFTMLRRARLASVFLRHFTTTPNTITHHSSSLLLPPLLRVFDSAKTASCFRHYHDGRPRGPLWRGKKLIGKEALFVIQGLKRFKDDHDKLHKFIKNHVLRLLKLDLIAVLTELERQEEVSLALTVSFSFSIFSSIHSFIVLLVARGVCSVGLTSMLANFQVFKVTQKQDWYIPDKYLYKDLIIALARAKKMDEVMEMWESMKKENLYPDSQTYTEVIRGFLKYGSPADAMNVYEDMKNSPDPPEELPFRILLKGLLPHPLLRNKVKQDFEEIFPDSSIYDPPQEIFGVR